ncbi:MAG: hypothetical protein AOA66_1599 [Candidatus Bathyarchaeota archaeon BA2]|nr:MAG: hypothetical protein AOA66_1599 [Candidatus Bathyarchaeota archaeon BA2]
MHATTGFCTIPGGLNKEEKSLYAKLLLILHAFIVMVGGDFGRD